MASIPPPAQQTRPTTYRYRGLVARVDAERAVAIIPLKTVTKQSGALHGLPATQDIALHLKDCAGPELKPDMEVTFEVEVGDEPGAYRAVKASVVVPEAQGSIKRYRGQISEMDADGGKIALRSVCLLDGLVVGEGHDLMTTEDPTFKPTDCNSQLRFQLKKGATVNFQVLRIPSDSTEALRAIKVEPVIVTPDAKTDVEGEPNAAMLTAQPNKTPSNPPPAIAMQTPPAKEPTVVITNGMAGGHQGIKPVKEAAWNEARSQESGLRKFFETDMGTKATATAFNAAVDAILAPDAAHLDQVLEEAGSLKAEEGLSPFDKAVAQHKAVLESSGLDELLEEFISRCLRYKLSNGMRDHLLPFIGGATHYVHMPVALRLIEALSGPMTDDERQKLFDRLVGVIAFFEEHGRLNRIAPPMIPIDELVEIAAGSPILYFFLDEERRDKAKRGEIRAQEAPEIRFMCNLFGQNFADLIQLFNGDKLRPQSQFKQAMPPVSTMKAALQAVANKVFDHVVIFSSDYRTIGRWKPAQYDAGGDPVVIGLIGIGDDRALPFFFPLGRSSGRGIASGNDLLLAHIQQMIRETLKEKPGAWEGFNDPELAWYDVAKKSWVHHKQTLANGSDEGDRGAYLKNHFLKNAERALAAGRYYDWLRQKWDPLQS